jgi:hypothetical protein
VKKNTDRIDHQLQTGTKFIDDHQGTNPGGIDEKKQRNDDKKLN